MAELRLARAAVDGLTIHYVVAGQGPTVVLIHGLGGFAESWRHNLDALATRARVYALDLPGFGQSAKPRAHYDLDFFATVVRGFLDRIGAPRASLVGHSIGGAVAVACALAAPDRVERLALLGAVVPGVYRLSLPYRLGVVAGFGDLLSLVRCTPLYKASIARCLHRPVRAEVDFLVDHAWAARTGMPARRAFLSTLRHLRDDLVVRGARYRSALGGLDLPTLLVHGRQDPVVPPGDARDTAGLVPGATVRWIDGCGHFPHVEHPGTVNDWLGDFLVGRPAPR